MPCGHEQDTFCHRHYPTLMYMIAKTASSNKKAPHVHYSGQVGRAVVVGLLELSLQQRLGLVHLVRDDLGHAQIL
jgi:hypothetical protein